MSTEFSVAIGNDNFPRRRGKFVLVGNFSLDDCWFSKHTTFLVGLFLPRQEKTRFSKLECTWYTNCSARPCIDAVWRKVHLEILCESFARLSLVCFRNHSGLVWSNSTETCDVLTMPAHCLCWISYPNILCAKVEGCWVVFHVHGASWVEVSAGSGPG